VLQEAVAGTSGSDLSLTPDLMDVAAAAESAISASALIIERHATYYGYDPEPRVRQSRQRRAMLDVLMREQAIKQMTNPVPLIPTGSLVPSPGEAVGGICIFRRRAAAPRFWVAETLGDPGGVGSLQANPQDIAPVTAEIRAEPSRTVVAGADGWPWFRIHQPSAVLDHGHLAGFGQPAGQAQLP
jgi:hypothetical protein